MWFDILFGTWDYLLSAVGVGHLGPTWSGGSAFSLLPLRSVRSHCGWSIPCWHSFSFFSWITMMDGYILWWMLYLLWWMLYLYWWMDVSYMVDGFIYFIILVSWIRRGWCISIFTYVYSFKPFIPCNMYSGWFSIPNLICQETFRTNVYYFKDIGLFIILSYGCGIGWT